MVVGKDEGVARFWVDTKFLPHLVTNVFQLNVVTDRTTNPTGDPSKVRHSEDCILGQPQLLPHLLAQIMFVSALTAIICL